VICSESDKEVFFAGRSLSDSSAVCPKQATRPRQLLRREMPRKASCAVPTSNHLEAFERIAPCVGEETFSVLNRFIVRLNIFTETIIVKKKKKLLVNHEFQKEVKEVKQVTAT
jgi:hypothetical protein